MGDDYGKNNEDNNGENENIENFMGKRESEAVKLPPIVSVNA